MTSIASHTDTKQRFGIFEGNLMKIKPSYRFQYITWKPSPMSRRTIDGHNFLHSLGRFSFALELVLFSFPVI